MTWTYDGLLGANKFLALCPGREIIARMYIGSKLGMFHVFSSLFAEAAFFGFRRDLGRPEDG